jgi:hypothetical protein
MKRSTAEMGAIPLRCFCRRPYTRGIKNKLTNRQTWRNDKETQRPETLLERSAAFFSVGFSAARRVVKSTARGG